MQKCAHLVELEKCCQTHIFLQKFVLIQPRTSPPKFAKFCKFEKNRSNLESKQTQVEAVGLGGLGGVDLGGLGARVVAASPRRTRGANPPHLAEGRGGRSRILQPKLDITPS